MIFVSGVDCVQSYVRPVCAVHLTAGPDGHRDHKSNQYIELTLAPVTYRI